METMTRVSATVDAQERASQSAYGDLRVTGRIGRVNLSDGCYTWYDILRLSAQELHRRGEAGRVRVMLKTEQLTVRAFLRQRFGIVIGARAYWHRPNWSPEKADLRDFLSALRQSHLHCST